MDPSMLGSGMAGFVVSLATVEKLMERGVLSAEDAFQIYDRAVSRFDAQEGAAPSKEHYAVLQFARSILEQAAAAVVRQGDG